MKYTIFAIDMNEDGYYNPGFLEWFRARSTQGDIVSCIGYYEGVQENSFLCLKEDFDRYIRGTHWVADQECVMHLSSCNKMYVDTEYLQDGVTTFSGCMRAVSREESMQHAGWTYRLDLDTYWTTVQENPNTIPSQDNPTKENTMRKFIGETLPFVLAGLIAYVLLVLFTQSVEAAVPELDSFTPQEAYECVTTDERQELADDNGFTVAGEIPGIPLTVWTNSDGKFLLEATIAGESCIVGFYYEPTA